MVTNYLLSVFVSLFLSCLFGSFGSTYKPDHWALAGALGPSALGPFLGCLSSRHEQVPQASGSPGAACAEMREEPLLVRRAGCWAGRCLEGGSWRTWLLKWSSSGTQGDEGQSQRTGGHWSLEVRSWGSGTHGSSSPGRWQDAREAGPGIREG